MQSGISVSQELRTAFNALAADPTSQRGLIAGIEHEQLVPLSTLASASGEFFSDLDALQASLKDNEAAYVILHRYRDAHDGFVAVTYVPDSAPVRQKMLFASTRLTLARELGSERFRDTLFATTKAELTAAGFKRHDAHGELKAPLTEEERTLLDVREAELEASRSTGARRDLPQGASKATPVAEEAIDALTALPHAQYNLVQLKINVQTETVELVSTSSAELQELPRAISGEGARYSLFRYEHSFEGQTQSPIIFITTCPSGLKVKERMVHAASRVPFLKTVEGQTGLELYKKLEIGDPSEITPSAIHEELHPTTEQKTGFSRPKRPGRK